jgi:hypothetical protein
MLDAERVTPGVVEIEDVTADLFGNGDSRE